MYSNIMFIAVIARLCIRVVPDMSTQVPEGFEASDEGVAEAEGPAESERIREEDQLPMDVVYNLLSNQRRRRIIRHLQEEHPTTLGELAEWLARIEKGGPDTQITSTERKRAYVGLYQHHLPKLDDADIVEFDQDRKTIESGSNIDQVMPYLRVDISGESQLAWRTVVARKARTILDWFR